MLAAQDKEKYAASAVYLATVSQVNLYLEN